MKHIVVYIHGKGGNAAEADYYKQFFANAEVIGFDYKAQTPREAEAEFVPYFNALREKYDKITLIANSIGAYFAFNTLTKKQVDEAIFISPVADMAALIENMMRSNGVSEAELHSKKEISVPGGETLSWKYYCYAREHTPAWLAPALNPECPELPGHSPAQPLMHIPAHIICGDRDMLTPPEKMRAFAAKIGASVTVMPGGEHWFHTPEQMRFLNAQITRFSGGFHKKT